MKNQLIPAIGLAALMAWCGYQIALVHPPQEPVRAQHHLQRALPLQPQSASTPVGVSTARVKP